MFVLRYSVRQRVVVTNVKYAFRSHIVLVCNSDSDKMRQLAGAQEERLTRITLLLRLMNIQKSRFHA